MFDNPERKPIVIDAVRPPQNFLGMFVASSTNDPRIRSADRVIRAVACAIPTSQKIGEPNTLVIEDLTALNESLFSSLSEDLIISFGLSETKKRIMKDPRSATDAPILATILQSFIKNNSVVPPALAVRVPHVLASVSVAILEAKRTGSVL
mmetsp:Transcript_1204/g.2637  ORF Transcript_1204/g.2637 Transcript_1204/m.2637 type:complete len:151 (-) Transcript_1204:525-977(-)